ncbi:MAG TPA: hypothetical protein VFD60_00470 [Nitrososphaeraceae archaeon]|nr:hypothetical protein [Nitrososphaeraceae archaeon]
MLDDKNNNHHIIDNDIILDWIVKSMKSVNGRIAIDMGNEPAMQINAAPNRIDIDLLHPELFKFFKVTEDEDKRGRMDKIKVKLNTAKEFAEKLTDSETGLFDKLNTPKEFAQKLTDNDMTLALLRKGKEAIILGKDAKPTVSKLISRSDDMQIKSVREVSKLGSDLKAED